MKIPENKEGIWVRVNHKGMYSMYMADVWRHGTKLELHGCSIPEGDSAIATIIDSDRKRHLYIITVDKIKTTYHTSINTTGIVETPYGIIKKSSTVCTIHHNIIPLNENASLKNAA